MADYTGGCLCGSVRYVATGEPIDPHLCSCTECRSWSGAPTVAWVEFELSSFKWTGKQGEPKYYNSTVNTKLGSCPNCGSSICAVGLSDDTEAIVMVIGSLDNPGLVAPDPSMHSYSSSRPVWWKEHLLVDSD